MKKTSDGEVKKENMFVVTGKPVFTDNIHRGMAEHYKRAKKSIEYEEIQRTKEKASE